MNRLLVITAQDGSSLVLGEQSGDRQQPAALFFEHVGRGEPRPVTGLFSPFSVIVDDKRHVVFAGTSFSEPSVDAVLVQFPDHGRTYPVQKLLDRPGVWMSFPEPFYDGQSIRATWLVNNQAYHEETTAPLVWEPFETPNPGPHEPDQQRVASIDDDGFTRTYYAYFEDEEDPPPQTS